MDTPETDNQKGGAFQISHPRIWWVLMSSMAVALVVGLGFLNIVDLIALPLAVLIFGITIATALDPLVSWLGNWMPRLAAMLLTYVLLLVLFAGLIWVVTPTLVNQVEDFGGRIPDLVDRAGKFIERWRGNLPGGSFTDTVISQLSDLGPALLRLPLTITSGISGMLLILFVSFYILLEASAIQTFFLSLFPAEGRSHINEVLTAMGSAMGGYVRGVVINGVIVGLLTFLGLELLGINFALTFGVLAGLLELIPVAGPIVAGLLIVGFTLLQSPGQALIALVFMVVLQQVENNVLVPNIMRNQTEVSPLMSILAVFTGFAIGGLIGALIAIPIAGALRVLVREMVAPAIRGQTGAQPQGEASQ